MRLTDISLRSLKPGLQQYAVFDDAFPNFGVRIGTTGKLSFFVMYRSNGQRKRDTLGQYPILSLAEARRLARQRLAKLVLQDKSPDHRPITNFAAAVGDFMQMHCAILNKPRTAEETRRLLNRHWLPPLSHRTLQDIRTQDVSRTLDALLDTPSEALHALAAIRKFFNWAHQRRLIERSPCEGLQLGIRPRSRTRVLSIGELVKIYRAAEAIGYPYGCIVQLLALTGQRRSEIAGLRWSNIDEAGRQITLPRELVKNNREHMFVYGDLVAGVLSKLPRIGDLLFPARGSEGRPFSGWSKAKSRLDRSTDVSFALHDLRRTWATRSADLGVHPWVIEAHLNHASGVVSGVSAIYNRYSYLKEARSAVDQFDEQFSKSMRAQ